MFKQLLKSTVISALLLTSSQSLLCNQERDLIKQCIDGVIGQIPSMLSDFRALANSSQNLVLDLFSNVLKPKNFPTQDHATRFQTNILGHLENDNAAKSFFQKYLQEISTACESYLHYLETLFEAESKNVKNDVEKYNLFINLNQRAFELYQMCVSFYYDALYSYIKEMSPNSLMAIIGDDGDILPSNKRSKKIPSIEEIQELIKEAQAHMMQNQTEAAQAQA